MEEVPIVFSGPMVRAILDGRKTVTRRLLKVQPIDILPMKVGLPSENSQIAWITLENRENSPHGRVVGCRYGKPGDRLWAITIKPIPGYTRYGAGDDGNIYRIDCQEPRKMAACPTSRGYLGVSLCEPTGQRKSRFVHYLIFDAFYNRPEWKGEIRHLDGDRRNNVPENLDFGTAAQNWADRRAMRRAIHEDHHAAKLDWEKVRVIRSSSEATRSIARRLGVAQSTIQEVRRGKTWVETTEAPPVNLPRWASRITLEVTGVRVERVQEITEEEAKAEGVQGPSESPLCVGDCRTHYSHFRELWDSLNAKRGFGWDKNPWVWVVDFRKAGQKS